METRLRMLLVLGGLPMPEVNPVLRTRDGEPVRKYDLYYRASRTVVEYDGRHHIERERAWERDISRREGAETEGDRFIVVTATDVYRQPAATLERVHQVLTQRREPNVPKRLRQEWILHFRA
jgi:very-short-patch-repair endonuclease